MVTSINVPRTSFGGSSNNADVLAWAGGGQTILLQGFQTTYLFKLDQINGQWTSTLLWHNPNGLQFAVSSPDGKYLLWNETIYDAHNGWPVYRFADDEYYYAQWTTTGIILFDHQDSHDQVNIYRFSDLPLSS